MVIAAVKISAREARAGPPKARSADRRPLGGGISKKQVPHLRESSSTVKNATARTERDRRQLEIQESKLEKAARKRGGGGGGGGGGGEARRVSRSKSLAGAAEVFDRLGQLEPIASPSMYSDIRVGRLMASRRCSWRARKCSHQSGIHHR